MNEKILKVSDCHTGNFTLVQEKKLDEISGEFKNVDITICDVCRRPCKVVEMIVDDIKASEEE